LRKEAEEYSVRTPAAVIWPFPRIVINNGREKDRILSLLSIAVRLGSVMTTKTKLANPAQQYLCIQESVGKLVYKYYNEVLSDADARTFEEHLLLCFRCQETLFSLDAIFESLSSNGEQWLEMKESSEKRVAFRPRARHRES
jgi:hypothetical protein